MPNFESGSAVVASARWHLRCPLCNQAEGAVRIEERVANNSVSTLLTCSTCGLLGEHTGYDWDWATPSHITEMEHGKSAAIRFAVWLRDNPPDAVTQLAAVARRTPALQSGHDDGDGPTPCPTCGHVRTDGVRAGDAEDDRAHG